jgi:hypothetical protein
MSFKNLYVGPNLCSHRRRFERELDRSYAKPAVELERYHFLADHPKLRPQPLKLQLPEASKF